MPQKRFLRSFTFEHLFVFIVSTSLKREDYSEKVTIKDVLTVTQKVLITFRVIKAMNFYDFTR